MNRSLSALARTALTLGLTAWAAMAIAPTASAQGMMMPPGQPMAPGPGMPGVGMAPPPVAPPPVCNDFMKLRDETEKKAQAIAAVNKRHGDRKEMCEAVTKFTAAEAAVVKFLTDNKTWCGVPNDAIANAKAGHEKTLKFREVVCAEGPKPKVPTLSEAIGTPTLDTAKNTRTGVGTFDTLTGNPLAK